MKLRYQLFAISLCLFILPWGAWQYLKAVNVALRESQTQSLLDSTRLLTDRFSLEAYLLDAPFIGLPNNVDDKNFSELYFSSYAYPLKNAPNVDGYSDEWRDTDINVKHIVNTVIENFSMSVQVASHQDRVYFYLDVTDDDVRYYNPLTSQLLGEDHIQMTLYDTNKKPIDYLIRASAPSRIVAHYYNNDGVLLRENNIKGVWRETSQGYQIELSVDKQLLRNGFLLAAVDQRVSDKERHNAAIQWQAQGREREREQDRIEQNNTGTGSQNNQSRIQKNVINFSDQPVWLTTFSPNIQTLLKKIHAPSLTVKILNSQQWLVAVVPATARNNTRRVPWLVEWFYRQLLDSEKLPLRNTQLYDSYQVYTELAQSVEKGVALQWYRGGQGSLSRQTLASVAKPIYERGTQKLRGYLLVEKTTDQLIALTTSAFSQLFIYTMGAFLVVAFALLFYASWLSLRIRRLNDAVSDAVNEQGDLVLDEKAWPDVYRKDELGELARAYRQLLLQQQEYNDYLRTLSSKLSHELRTPIAVVRSSLENMMQVDDLSAQQKYHQRAQQGIQRLHHILSAMSSASSVEQSVRHVDFERVDLYELLTVLVTAYNDVYSTHHIHFESSLTHANAMISQELFVQMMDKLIDNAVDFSLPQNTIMIRLRNDQHNYYIDVDNIGPLLSDSMQGNMFESMVSLREKHNADQIHLGLGLYIVKIIAACHGGKVTAINRADDLGVVFSVEIPECIT